jgi:hypothetical protein
VVMALLVGKFFGSCELTMMRKNEMARVFFEKIILRFLGQRIEGGSPGKHFF